MKTTYYTADADGYLQSTLYLDEADYAFQSQYRTLLTEAPPIRPPHEYLAPSVAELKATKNAAITARRVLEDQRFQFGGKWFQADLAAWKQISGTHGWVSAQGSLPPGFPGWWKAEDNTYTPIPDVTTWWQFYAAVLARGAANMIHGESLKAQLAAATTPEEVEAVPAW